MTEYILKSKKTVSVQGRQQQQIWSMVWNDDGDEMSSRTYNHWQHQKTIYTNQCL